MPRTSGLIEFILLWNSRQSTPSSISHRLADRLRASGRLRRLMSASSSTPSRRTTSAIGAVGGEILKPPGLGPVEGPSFGFFQERRHGHAISAEASGEPLGAELVDQLERAVFPVVAEAHGLIDGDDVVGDLGREMGRIAQGPRQDPPAIGAAFVFIFEQGPQAALARLADALQRRLAGCAIRRRSRGRGIP